MKRVAVDLRSAWQSLAEAEGDSPGFDYDRGYLTGWYEARRSIRKRIRPDGGYRGKERVAEFYLGYLHGREDGVGRPTDWWPGYARGGIPL